MHNVRWPLVLRDCHGQAAQTGPLLHFWRRGEALFANQYRIELEDGVAQASLAAPTFRLRQEQRPTAPARMASLRALRGRAVDHARRRAQEMGRR